MTTTPVPEIEDKLTDHMMPPLLEVPRDQHVLSLVQRFLIPPFTQLDARSGEWQRRKAMWFSSGLRSAEGRSARTFAQSAGKDEVSQKILAVSGGQSIFDPVLCEMAYLWFCPPGGTILDPFAGGSVRGVVAAFLGYRYIGIDLSHEQILANYDQDADFREKGLYDDDTAPLWIEGDSAEVLPLLASGKKVDGHAKPKGGYDFVWSCPPYHDLERYSDNPRDLSNMPWPEFLRFYKAIIGYSVDMLADDRFAAFVVGEIRGPDGLYRHFVNETTDGFEKGGASYYNEAILVSPAGTLPLRAAKQFVVSRKMGRTHQTVLTFVKGDPKAAAAACMNKTALDSALRAAGVVMDDAMDAEDEDFSGMRHG